MNDDREHDHSTHTKAPLLIILILVQPEYDSLFTIYLHANKLSAYSSSKQSGWSRADTHFNDAWDIEHEFIKANKCLSI
jgi:hypothetical protein